MRAPWLALVLAGCFDTPTGVAQTWPPPRGIAVQQVTASDVDGDGVSDIVLYSSGGSPGMYLLRGRTDVFAGAPALVSFSKFVPEPFTAPLGVYQSTTVANGNMFVLYRDAGAYDALTLSIVDRTLQPLGDPRTIPTGITGGSGAWIHAATFPQDTQRLLISDGATLEHVSLDGTDVQTITAPSLDWLGVDAATTYATGSGRTLVVATDTETFASAIPTSGPYTWTTIRGLASPMWHGQTAIDLNGDGREEIVGFDAGMPAICALDTMTATVGCASVPMAVAGAEVTVIAGANVAGTSAPDLLLVQASAAGTDVTVVPDYVYSTIFNSAGTAETMHSSISHGLAAVAHGLLVGSDAVFVVGSDGTGACVVGC
jgi:hypothetical protein